MNKNRKGFTLVELIVVVTIFGVILGAILNMIKPANNVYHDADATMESNIIGSGLIDYLDVILGITHDICKMCSRKLSAHIHSLGAAHSIGHDNRKS